MPSRDEPNPNRRVYRYRKVFLAFKDKSSERKSVESKRYVMSTDERMMEVERVDGVGSCYVERYVDVDLTIPPSTLVVYRLDVGFHTLFFSLGLFECYRSGKHRTRFFLYHPYRAVNEWNRSSAQVPRLVHLSLLFHLHKRFQEMMIQFQMIVD